MGTKNLPGTWKFATSDQRESLVATFEANFARFPRDPVLRSSLEFLTKLPNITPTRGENEGDFAKPSRLGPGLGTVLIVHIASDDAIAAFCLLDFGYSSWDGVTSQICSLGVLSESHLSAPHDWTTLGDFLRRMNREWGISRTDIYTPCPPIQTELVDRCPIFPSHWADVMSNIGAENYTKKEGWLLFKLNTTQKSDGIV